MREEGRKGRDGSRLPVDGRAAALIDQPQQRALCPAARPAAVPGHACRPLNVQICDMLVLANNQSSAKNLARVKLQAQEAQ